jgi:hypothetical protein
MPRLNREMLLKHGVPSDAIGEFVFSPHSTYGEARGVLAWTKTNDAKSVIIPIDIFPSRRVRCIFNRELEWFGIHVTVLSISSPEYSVDNWWQHKDGRSHFRSELIKLAYYLLRY